MLGSSILATTYQLDYLQVNCGKSVVPEAVIALIIDGEKHTATA